MSEVRLEFQKIAPNAILPKYATEQAAGLDLYACLDLVGVDFIQVYPECVAMIPTGISVAVPVGFEAQVRPRSGLAARHGITVLNSPGTIDSDYRGEIVVLLYHTGCALPMRYGDAPQIRTGDRIAQLVVSPCPRWAPEFVERLPRPESSREGGFGSTGA